MADVRHKTDGPSPLSAEGYDESLLPDFDHDFISEEHLHAFSTALSAPDPSPSSDDLSTYSQAQSPREPSTPHRSSIDMRRNSRIVFGGSGSNTPGDRGSLFITAQNDWAPVNPTKLGGRGKRKGDKRKTGRKPRRSKDETREGYLYSILKWPLLLVVSMWIGGLGLSYLVTRLYVWTYEYFIAVSDFLAR